MLNFLGKRGRPGCDGISRRAFLSAGSLVPFVGLGGGLSLADILRAEATSGKKMSHKGVINVFLGGGPPHQDMWEIKTEAPKEIRGPFKPISTKVPGIQICEVFPKIAAMMDKVAVIRTVVDNRGGHDSHQCLAGWPHRYLKGMGGFPSIGSVAWKLQGSVDPGVPAAVGLAEPTRHVPWSWSGNSGFLPHAFEPFIPDKAGLANLTLNGVTADRFEDRKRLLTDVDNVRRVVDAKADGFDAYTQAAFNVLTSSRLLDALDLSKEDPKVRERYGDGKPFKFQYDGAPTVNEHLLIARRLILAGARSVSLSYGRWDSHGNNEGLVLDHGAKLDQCVTALIEDLDDRGMLDDVLVVVWGEFGRTPKINKNGGRDHWPQNNCCLLAGGNLKVGQAIGKTNRLGEVPEERPVRFQEIISTIYHCLGIDTGTQTLIDPAGRPQYLTDDREPVRELV